MATHRPAEIDALADAIAEELAAAGAEEPTAAPAGG
jgi:hypothetical protein